MKFAQAIPMLLLTSCLLFVGYAVYSDRDIDELARQQANAVTEAVNGLPQMQATVGQPPDTQWVSERVINLPEDGGMWHTVLVLDDSPLSGYVARMFNETPRLLSLTSQTKTYQYRPTDPWVKQNRNGYPVPSVLVMRPSIEGGGTNQFNRVYEQWASGIPGDGERLADDIAKMIGRPCPSPQPTPQPLPQPVPPNNVPLVPLAPETQPAIPGDDLPAWVYLLAAAAGAAGGGGLAFKKAY